MTKRVGYTANIPRTPRHLNKNKSADWLDRHCISEDIRDQLQRYEMKSARRFARCHELTEERREQQRLLIHQQHTSLDPVNQQILVNDSKIFNQIINAIQWNIDTPMELRDEIVKHIQDVYDRKGYSIASELAQILDSYQHRVGKSKFDIGRLNDTEFVLKVNKELKRRQMKPLELPPEHEAEIRRTVQILHHYGIIRKI